MAARFSAFRNTALFLALALGGSAVTQATPRDAVKHETDKISESGRRTDSWPTFERYTSPELGPDALPFVTTTAHGSVEESLKRLQHNALQLESALKLLYSVPAFLGDEASGEALVQKKDQFLASLKDDAKMTALLDAFLPFLKRTHTKAWFIDTFGVKSVDDLTSADMLRILREKVKAKQIAPALAAFRAFQKETEAALLKRFLEAQGGLLNHFLTPAERKLSREDIIRGLAKEQQQALAAVTPQIYLASVRMNGLKSETVLPRRQPLSRVAIGDDEIFKVFFDAAAVQLDRKTMNLSKNERITLRNWIYQSYQPGESVKAELLLAMEAADGQLKKRLGGDDLRSRLGVSDIYNPTPVQISERARALVERLQAAQKKLPAADRKVVEEILAQPDAQQREAEGAIEDKALQRLALLELPPGYREAYALIAKHPVPFSKDAANRTDDFRRLMSSMDYLQAIPRLEAIIHNGGDAREIAPVLARILGQPDLADLAATVAAPKKRDALTKALDTAMRKSAGRPAAADLAGYLAARLAKSMVDHEIAAPSSPPRAIADQKEPFDPAKPVAVDTRQGLLRYFQKLVDYAATHDIDPEKLPMPDFVTAKAFSPGEVAQLTEFVAGYVYSRRFRSSEKEPRLYEQEYQQLERAAQGKKAALRALLRAFENAYRKLPRELDDSTPQRLSETFTPPPYIASNLKPEEKDKILSGFIAKNSETARRMLAVLGKPGLTRGEAKQFGLDKLTQYQDGRAMADHFNWQGDDSKLVTASEIDDLRRRLAKSYEGVMHYARQVHAKSHEGQDKPFEAISSPEIASAEDSLRTEGWRNLPWSSMKQAAYLLKDSPVALQLANPQYLQRRPTEQDITAIRELAFNNLKGDGGALDQALANILNLTDAFGPLPRIALSAKTAEKDKQLAAYLTNGSTAIRSYWGALQWPGLTYQQARAMGMDKLVRYAEARGMNGFFEWPENGDQPVSKANLDKLRKALSDAHRDLMRFAFEAFSRNHAIKEKPGTLDKRFDSIWNPVIADTEDLVRPGKKPGVPSSSLLLAANLLKDPKDTATLVNLGKQAALSDKDIADIRQLALKHFKGDGKELDQALASLVTGLDYDHGLPRVEQGATPSQLAAIREQFVNQRYSPNYEKLALAGLKEEKKLVALRKVPSRQLKASLDSVDDFFKQCGMSNLPLAMKGPFLRLAQMQLPPAGFYLLPPSLKKKWFIPPALDPKTKKPLWANGPISWADIVDDASIPDNAWPRKDNEPAVQIRKIPTESIIAMLQKQPELWVHLARHARNEQYRVVPPEMIAAALAHPPNLLSALNASLAPWAKDGTIDCNAVAELVRNPPDDFDVVARFTKRFWAGHAAESLRDYTIAQMAELYPGEKTKGVFQSKGVFQEPANPALVARLRKGFATIAKADYWDLTDQEREARFDAVFDQMKNCVKANKEPGFLCSPSENPDRVLALFHEIQAYKDATEDIRDGRRANLSPELLSQVAAYFTPGRLTSQKRALLMRLNFGQPESPAAPGVPGESFAERADFLLRFLAMKQEMANTTLANDSDFARRLYPLEKAVAEAQAAEDANKTKATTAATDAAIEAWEKHQRTFWPMMQEIDNRYLAFSYRPFLPSDFVSATEKEPGPSETKPANGAKAGEGKPASGRGGVAEVKGQKAPDEKNAEAKANSGQMAAGEKKRPYVPVAKFDEKGWHANLDYNYDLAHELLNKDLAGIKQYELERMLGNNIRAITGLSPEMAARLRHANSGSSLAFRPYARSIQPATEEDLLRARSMLRQDALTFALFRDRNKPAPARGQSALSPDGDILLDAARANLHWLREARGMDRSADRHGDWLTYLNERLHVVNNDIHLLRDQARGEELVGLKNQADGPRAETIKTLEEERDLLAQELYGNRCGSTQVTEQPPGEKLYLDRYIDVGAENGCAVHVKFDLPFSKDAPYYEHYLNDPDGYLKLAQQHLFPLRQVRSNITQNETEWRSVYGELENDAEKTIEHYASGGLLIDAIGGKVRYDFENNEQKPKILADLLRRAQWTGRPSSFLLMLGYKLHEKVGDEKKAGQYRAFEVLVHQMLQQVFSVGQTSVIEGKHDRVYVKYFDRPGDDEPEECDGRLTSLSELRKSTYPTRDGRPDLGFQVGEGSSDPFSQDEALSLPGQSRWERIGRAHGSIDSTVRALAGILGITKDPESTQRAKKAYDILQRAKDGKRISPKDELEFDKDLAFLRAKRKNYCDDKSIQLDTQQKIRCLQRQLAQGNNDRAVYDKMVAMAKHQARDFAALQAFVDPLPWNSRLKQLTHAASVLDGLEELTMDPKFVPYYQNFGREFCLRLSAMQHSGEFKDLDLKKEEDRVHAFRRIHDISVKVLAAHRAPWKTAPPEEPKDEKKPEEDKPADPAQEDPLELASEKREREKYQPVVQTMYDQAVKQNLAPIGEAKGVDEAFTRANSPADLSAAAAKAVAPENGNVSERELKVKVLPRLWTKFQGDLAAVEKAIGAKSEEEFKTAVAALPPKVAEVYRKLELKEPNLKLEKKKEALHLLRIGLQRIVGDGQVPGAIDNAMTGELMLYDKRKEDRPSADLSDAFEIQSAQRPTYKATQVLSRMPGQGLSRVLSTELRIDLHGLADRPDYFEAEADRAVQGFPLRAGAQEQRRNAPRSQSGGQDKVMDAIRSVISGDGSRRGSLANGNGAQSDPADWKAPHVSFEQFLGECEDIPLPKSPEETDAARKRREDRLAQLSPPPLPKFGEPSLIVKHTPVWPSYPDGDSINAPPLKPDQGKSPLLGPDPMRRYNRETPEGRQEMLRDALWAAGSIDRKFNTNVFIGMPGYAKFNLQQGAKDNPDAFEALRFLMSQHVAWANDIHGIPRCYTRGPLDKRQLTLLIVNFSPAAIFRTIWSNPSLLQAYLSHWQKRMLKPGEKDLADVLLDNPRLAVKVDLGEGDLKFDKKAALEKLIAEKKIRQQIGADANFPQDAKELVELRASMLDRGLLHSDSLNWRDLLEKLPYLNARELALVDKLAKDRLQREEAGEKKDGPLAPERAAALEVVRLMQKLPGYLLIRPDDEASSGIEEPLRLIGAGETFVAAGTAECKDGSCKNVLAKLPEALANGAGNPAAGPQKAQKVELNAEQKALYQRVTDELLKSDLSTEERDHLVQNGLRLSAGYVAERGVPAPKRSEPSVILPPKDLKNRIQSLDEIYQRKLTRVLDLYRKELPARGIANARAQLDRVLSHLSKESIDAALNSWNDVASSFDNRYQKPAVTRKKVIDYLLTKRGMDYDDATWNFFESTVLDMVVRDMAERNERFKAGLLPELDREKLQSLKEGIEGAEGKLHGKELHQAYNEFKRQLGKLIEERNAVRLDPERKAAIGRSFDDLRRAHPVLSAIQEMEMKLALEAQKQFIAAHTVPTGMTPEQEGSRKAAAALGLGIGSRNALTRAATATKLTENPTQLPLDSDPGLTPEEWAVASRLVPPNSSFYESLAKHRAYIANARRTMPGYNSTELRILDRHQALINELAKIAGYADASGHAVPGALERSDNKGISGLDTEQTLLNGSASEPGLRVQLALNEANWENTWCRGEDLEPQRNQPWLASLSGKLPKFIADRIGGPQTRRQTTQRLAELAWFEWNARKDSREKLRQEKQACLRPFYEKKKKEIDQYDQELKDLALQEKAEAGPENRIELLKQDIEEIEFRGRAIAYVECKELKHETPSFASVPGVGVVLVPNEGLPENPEKNPPAVDACAKEVKLAVSAKGTIDPSARDLIRMYHNDPKERSRAKQINAIQLRVFRDGLTKAEAKTAWLRETFAKKKLQAEEVAKARMEEEKAYIAEHCPEADKKTSLTDFMDEFQQKHLFNKAKHAGRYSGVGALKPEEDARRNRRYIERYLELRARVENLGRVFTQPGAPALWLNDERYLQWKADYDSLCASRPGDAERLMTSTFVSATKRYAEEEQKLKGVIGRLQDKWNIRIVDGQLDYSEATLHAGKWEDLKADLTEYGKLMHYRGAIAANQGALADLGVLDDINPADQLEGSLVLRYYQSGRPEVLSFPFTDTGRKATPRSAIHLARQADGTFKFSAVDIKPLTDEATGLVSLIDRKIRGVKAEDRKMWNDLKVDGVVEGDKGRDIPSIEDLAQKCIESKDSMWSDAKAFARWVSSWEQDREKDERNEARQLLEDNEDEKDNDTAVAQGADPCSLYKARRLKVAALNKLLTRYGDIEVKPLINSSPAQGKKMVDHYQQQFAHQIEYSFVAKSQSTEHELYEDKMARYRQYELTAAELALTLPISYIGGPVLQQFAMLEKEIAAATTAGNLTKAAALTLQAKKLMPMVRLTKGAQSVISGIKLHYYGAGFEEVAHHLLPGAFEAPRFSRGEDQLAKSPLSFLASELGGGAFQALGFGQRAAGALGWFGGTFATDATYDILVSGKPVDRALHSAAWSGVSMAGLQIKPMGLLSKARTDGYIGLSRGYVGKTLDGKWIVPNWMARLGLTSRGPAYVASKIDSFLKTVSSPAFYAGAAHMATYDLGTQLAQEVFGPDAAERRESLAELSEQIERAKKDGNAGQVARLSAKYTEEIIKPYLAKLKGGIWMYLGMAGKGQIEESRHYNAQKAITLLGKPLDKANRAFLESLSRKGKELKLNLPEAKPGEPPPVITHQILADVLGREAAVEYLRAAKDAEEFSQRAAQIAEYQRQAGEEQAIELMHNMSVRELQDMIEKRPAAANELATLLGMEPQVLREVYAEYLTKHPQPGKIKRLAAGVVQYGEGYRPAWKIIPELREIASAKLKARLKERIPEIQKALDAANTPYLHAAKKEELKEQQAQVDRDLMHLSFLDNPEHPTWWEHLEPGRMSNPPTMIDQLAIRAFATAKGYEYFPEFLLHQRIPPGATWQSLDTQYQEVVSAPPAKLAAMLVKGEINYGVVRKLRGDKGLSDVVTLMRESTDPAVHNPELADRYSKLMVYLDVAPILKDRFGGYRNLEHALLSDLELREPKTVEHFWKLVDELGIDRQEAAAHISEAMSSGQSGYKTIGQLLDEMEAKHPKGAPLAETIQGRSQNGQTFELKVADFKPEDATDQRRALRTLNGLTEDGQPNPDYVKYTALDGLDPQKLEERIGHMVETAAKEKDQPKRSSYTKAFRDGSGRIVGAASLTRADGGVWQLSVAVAPDQQQKGYGTAIAKEMVRFAHEHLNANAVTATVHPENAAGHGMLKDAGFTPLLSEGKAVKSKEIRIVDEGNQNAKSSPRDMLWIRNPRVVERDNERAGGPSITTVNEEISVDHNGTTTKLQLTELTPADARANRLDFEKVFGFNRGVWNTDHLKGTYFEGAAPHEINAFIDKIVTQAPKDRSSAARHSYSLAVRDSAGKMICLAIFSRQRVGSKVWEIQLIPSPEYAQPGRFQALVAQARQFAFDKLGADRVEAAIHASNHKEAKLYLGAGFSLEPQGRPMNTKTASGKLVPFDVYVAERNPEPNPVELAFAAEKDGKAVELRADELTPKDAKEKRDELRAVFGYRDGAYHPEQLAHTEFAGTSANGVEALIDNLVAEGTKEAGGTNRSRYVLPIRDAEGHTVGLGTLTRDTEHPKLWKLGFLVAPAHAGKGYGTAIARELSHFAFERLGATAVDALVHPDNDPSKKALSNAGFKPQPVIERVTIGGVASPRHVYRVENPMLAAADPANERVNLLQIPKKLSLDQAIELLHRVTQGTDRGDHLSVLGDMVRDNRLANAILKHSGSPAKTMDKVIKALKPEITNLQQAKDADYVIAGLGNVMPLYYAMRYSDALSPDLRKTFIENAYKPMAYLFHSRHAQLKNVRTEARLKKADPQLSSLEKYHEALKHEALKETAGDEPKTIIEALKHKVLRETAAEEPKAIIWNGSPPLVIRAYLPLIAKAKPGELKSAVQFVKAWFIENVHEFEGTQPKEVDTWMRMRSEVNLLRYAIEKLPITPETREAAAFLKDFDRPKTVEESKTIIARIKANSALNNYLKNHVTRWERQLESPDPLFREDVGRRVAHQLWNLEYLAEFAPDLERRLEAAKLYYLATGNRLEAPLEDRKPPSVPIGLKPRIAQPSPN